MIYLSDFTKIECTDYLAEILQKFLFSIFSAFEPRKKTTLFFRKLKIIVRMPIFYFMFTVTVVSNLCLSLNTGYGGSVPFCVLQCRILLRYTVRTAPCCAVYCCFTYVVLRSSSRTNASIFVPCWPWRVYTHTYQRSPNSVGHSISFQNSTSFVQVVRSFFKFLLCIFLGPLTPFVQGQGRSYLGIDTSLSLS